MQPRKMNSNAVLYSQTDLVRLGVTANARFECYSFNIS